MTTKELTVQLNRIEQELREVRYALYTQNSSTSLTEQKQVLSILQKIRTSTQSNWPEDPVAWQRKIRGEWTE